MAPAIFHQAMGTMLVRRFGNVSDSQYDSGSASVRLISNGFGVYPGSLRNGSSSSDWCTLHAIQVSGCRSSVVDPIVNPLQGTGNNSQSKSDETALTLLRHGESMWNVKNLFTGCIDVPLTEKGVEEAIEAGRRISNIPVDMIFTSALIRSQMTAMLAMTQHHCRKVPIIMHNESEEANRRSLIYSDETKKQSIPVVTAWQLNERMYGELQGYNKQKTAEKYGKEQVHKWRRSYDTSPPNGESLEVCSRRAVAYFEEQIKPQLLSGKHVLVTAHANSLRSIIMYLDNLTSQEVISLELSTGIPMLYIYKEGKFIRRGSPIGPTEAGVYAYSRSLALYRKQLDEMLQ
ncbi:2,3-bisphosphoglycerate-dependent phosphoglycerate mutase 1-like isoform X2 [Malania oleifera]|nr:2,3-bisphosphoglycerate-dependent phosphoglycerate mutase 1-like isoform X2 [Malania oleifera]XP_057969913.1 2,3-bisphosphoglycerate-dependent phosphoglycerate mutase 1-like isoform X2 [Malania oleifera]